MPKRADICSIAIIRHALELVCLRSQGFKKPIGFDVNSTRLVSNTLAQPSPLRERAFRGMFLGGRFALNSPLSLAGEGWGEGVTAVWQFTRILWYTLIQLRLSNALLSLHILLPQGRRGPLGQSGRFLAINNSCRIASSTPSKLSLTSLFQNRITWNPNASSTAVRAASFTVISTC
jgi:hypothetical protein